MELTTLSKKFRSSRRYGLNVFVALGLGLVFAACGSSDDDDSNNSGGTGGVETTTGGRSEGGSLGQPTDGGAGDLGGSPSSGATAGSGGASAGSGGAAQGGTETASGGATPSEGGNGGTGALPPGALDCEVLTALAGGAGNVECVDFADDSSADRFTPEGGTWTVKDGAYVATAPDERTNCSDGDPETMGSDMTASLLDGFSASALLMHARLTSIERPDKVIVLRERDSGNRIELNFRANFDDGGEPSGGDLVIQELLDCQFIPHVRPGTVLIPHEIGQPIDVDIELQGQSLRVDVDGEPAFSGTLDIATDAGSVGFAVITSSTAQFDDLTVESYD